MSISTRQYLFDTSSYSLADAAQRANCSDFDVLVYAGSGDIDLMVEVPDDVSVFSVESNWCKLEQAQYDDMSKRLLADRLRGLDPLKVKNIAFLTISALDCRKVEQHAAFKQDQFVSGYGITDTANLIKIPPMLPRDRSSSGFGRKPSSATRILATYQSDVTEEMLARGIPGYRKPICLSIDKLRIDEANLTILQAEFEQRTRNNNRSAETNSASSLIREDYMSERLFALNQVALTVWGKVYTDGDKYPTNDSVCDRLIECSINKKYESTLAKHAASIIRPEYANGTPCKSDQKRYRPTPLLDALNKTAEHFYKDKCSSNYPKQEIIETWLIDNHRFKDYQAKAGARIISLSLPKANRQSS